MSDPLNLSRRGLIRTLGAGAALAAVPAWAQGHSLRGHSAAPIRVGFDEVSGAVIDLAVVFMVFLVLNRYNPMMGFLTNRYSQALLWVFCACALAAAIALAARQRRER